VLEERVDVAVEVLEDPVGTEAPLRDAVEVVGVALGEEPLRNLRQGDVRADDEDSAASSALLGTFSGRMSSAPAMARRERMPWTRPWSSSTGPYKV